MNHYLQPTDPVAKQIAGICFPEYTGKKYSVSVVAPGMRTDSCWQGGSRDYWAVLQLSTMKVASIPENGSGFGQYKNALEMPLPAPDFALVRHSIFCGKDAGIHIYLHADNGAKLLPKPTEVTQNEKIVLVSTRSYKSSYAGVSNYRFVEARRDTGITATEWEEAKAALISRGLLLKTGAITVDGRNAAGESSLYSLAKPGHDRWGVA
jgi:hypothetical protein